MRKKERFIEESVHVLLRGAKLKATKPRLAMLDFLQREHGPFAIDQILKGVEKLGIRCDLVTIYRSLSQMEQAGIVGRCDFGDGVIRYELAHAGHHHHHLVCRLCQKVEILHHCPIENRAIKIPRSGYSDITHRLEFFGLCPDCQ